MTGNFQTFPKLNTRLMEDQIVKILLQVKDFPVDYPRELYQPRRDAYIAQIETVKESRPACRPDGGQ